MSDLLQEVTPLTRALVWLAPSELDFRTTNYRAVDYLLDGLLTASLNSSPTSDLVLVGKNFNRELFVLILRSELEKTQVENFLSLLEKDLGTEDKILILDEAKKREDFRRLVPQKILPHIHSL